MAELLAPAGSCDSLRAAVNAGADAVYIGGSLFGARAYADNPSEDELLKGIEYCHLRGKKLYLTVNTLLKEEEMNRLLEPYLRAYYEHGIDALIVQDLGVIRYLQRIFPDLELHASTQMSVTTPEGARLLAGRGVSRVVPARELTLEEVETLVREGGTEVEVFVHGAMCYCYSGRCLFSSMLGGRSGNRGRCAQPCRLPYSAGESGHPSFLLSMKDLCALDLLPDLLDAGVASFKIEGRMKRPEYTAGVVSIYRKYMDLYAGKGRDGYRVEEEDRRILLDLYNRGGFSEGYLGSKRGPEMMAFDRPNHQGTEAARILTEKGLASAAEPLYAGDVLESASGIQLTLAKNVQKGDSFLLPRPVKGKDNNGRRASFCFRKGELLFRTRADSLLADLDRRFLKENTRVKIHGDLRISEGIPAILTVWTAHPGSDGAVRVSAKGEIPFPARTNPAVPSAVERQMRKTGETPFEFETLRIRLDENLFIPVKQLNELRREALQKLQDAILKRKERREPSASGLAGPSFYGRTGPKREMGLNLFVTQFGQLDAVLSWVRESPKQPDTVYLDSFLLGMPQSNQEDCAKLVRAAEFLKERKIRCFLACPPVMRRQEETLFSDLPVKKVIGEMDGFLVNSVDQLAAVRDRFPRASLASEDCLYAFDTEAEAFLREEGVERITLPAEQNGRELRRIAGEDSELTVYGYQALMQSAQCVRKNTQGCTKTPGFLSMKDRKGVFFPVLCRCSLCCNTIYNSLPLRLGSCRDDILSLHPGWIRLSFTLETAEETREILEQYTELFFLEGKDAKNDTEGTRGHFKRGVE